MRERRDVISVDYLNYYDYLEIVSKLTSAPVTYLLRSIPRELWRNARIRAIRDGLDMRQVLLGFLKAYTAGRAKPERLSQKERASS